MPVLTAFADEIGPELQDQIRVLKDNGISHVELRGAFGVNVLKHSPDQRRQIRDEFGAAGIGVHTIASPIGKVKLNEPFITHWRDFLHACALCDEYQCKYIRIFSFYPPEGMAIGEYRFEVHSRLAAMVQEAERRGIVLAHENESHIYGNKPERALELAQKFHSPGFTNAFDAANYVQEQCEPIYETCWLAMRAHVAYVHLKDHDAKENKACPVGQGQGDWPKILADLASRGFDGPMAVEPHLSAAGQFAGFSGPKLFTAAVDAIRKECSQAGLNLR